MSSKSKFIAWLGNKKSCYWPGYENLGYIFYTKVKYFNNEFSVGSGAFVYGIDKHNLNKKDIVRIHCLYENLNAVNISHRYRVIVEIFKDPKALINEKKKCKIRLHEDFDIIQIADSNLFNISIEKLQGCCHIIFSFSYEDPLMVIQQNFKFYTHPVYICRYIIEKNNDNYTFKCAMQHMQFFTKRTNEIYKLEKRLDENMTKSNHSGILGKTKINSKYKIEKKFHISSLKYENGFVKMVLQNKDIENISENEIKGADSSNNESQNIEKETTLTNLILKENKSSQTLLKQINGDNSFSTSTQTTPIKNINDRKRNSESQMEYNNIELCSINEKNTKKNILNKFDWSKISKQFNKSNSKNTSKEKESKTEISPHKKLKLSNNNIKETELKETERKPNSNLNILLKKTIENEKLSKINSLSKESEIKTNVQISKTKPLVTKINGCSNVDNISENMSRKLGIITPKKLKIDSQTQNKLREISGDKSVIPKKNKNSIIDRFSQEETVNKCPKIKCKSSRKLIMENNESVDSKRKIISKSKLNNNVSSFKNTEFCSNSLEKSFLKCKNTNNNEDNIKIKSQIKARDVNLTPEASFSAKIESQTTDSTLIDNFIKPTRVSVPSERKFTSLPLKNELAITKLTQINNYIEPNSVEIPSKKVTFHLSEPRDNKLAQMDNFFEQTEVTKSLQEGAGSHTTQIELLNDAEIDNSEQKQLSSPNKRKIIEIMYQNGKLVQMEDFFEPAQEINSSKRKTTFLTTNIETRDSKVTEINNIFEQTQETIPSKKKVPSKIKPLDIKFAQKESIESNEVTILKLSKIKPQNDTFAQMENMFEPVTPTTEIQSRNNTFAEMDNIIEPVTTSKKKVTTLTTKVKPRNFNFAQMDNFIEQTKITTSKRRSVRTQIDSRVTNLVPKSPFEVALQKEAGSFMTQIEPLNDAQIDNSEQNQLSSPYKRKIIEIRHQDDKLIQMDDFFEPAQEINSSKRKTTSLNTNIETRDSTVTEINNIFDQTQETIPSKKKVPSKIKPLDIKIAQKDNFIESNEVTTFTLSKINPENDTFAQMENMFEPVTLSKRKVTTLTTEIQPRNDTFAQMDNIIEPVTTSKKKVTTLTTKIKPRNVNFAQMDNFIEQTKITTSSKRRRSFRTKIDSRVTNLVPMNSPFEVALQKEAGSHITQIELLNDAQIDNSEQNQLSSPNKRKIIEIRHQDSKLIQMDDIFEPAQEINYSKRKTTSLNTNIETRDSTVTEINNIFDQTQETIPSKKKVPSKIKPLDIKFAQKESIESNEVTILKLSKIKPQNDTFAQMQNMFEPVTPSKRKVTTPTTEIQPRNNMFAQMDNIIEPVTPSKKEVTTLTTKVKPRNVNFAQMDNFIQQMKITTSKRRRSFRTQIDSRVANLVPMNSPFEVARKKLLGSLKPGYLPCREKEFDDITQFINGKLVDKTGGCMYISGVPGTGKTATVCEVLKMLNIVSTRNFKLLTVNAMSLSEPRQVYVELDKLCTRKQDVIYNLLNLPLVSNTPFIIIAVANTINLPERFFNKKVGSRLGLTRLTFKPYKYAELIKIINVRLTSCDNIFQKEAIEYIARKVAAVSGDVRRGLFICSRATEIAEANHEKEITLDIVNKTLIDMNNTPIIYAIKSCSRMEKLILEAIASEVSRTGNDEVAFSNIAQVIEDLCILKSVQIPNTNTILLCCQKLYFFQLIIMKTGLHDISNTFLLNISAFDINIALNEK